MCGIAGCVGHHDAVGFVTGGLDLMEARGYDSAGIGYPNSEAPKIKVIKAIGVVANLVSKVPPEAANATEAIGHTRWATHGGISVKNAHPHTNNARTIAVVHNGIIENDGELKEELEDLGYTFKSETDTEVIPHLLDHYTQEGLDPPDAFLKTIRRLEGAYALLGFFGIEPDTIYATRQSAPLLMGVRGNERFVASSANTIMRATRWIDRLEEKEWTRLSSDPDKYGTWIIKGGRKTNRTPKEYTEEVETSSKGKHEHWMFKEILDGPDVVKEAIRGRVHSPEGRKRGFVRLGGLQSPEIKEKLKWTDRIAIVACGTSYHAGLIGERLIEDVAGIPVEVHMASEFQYRNKPLTRDTVVIGISQSGETADTIGALKKAKKQGLTILGINNSPASEMEAITDAGVHCRAGMEQSVASTKAFISQVTVLSEIALALGQKEGRRTALSTALLTELTNLPKKMEGVIANQDAIKAVAKKYADAQSFLYLGRGLEAVSAMEGALKLKEISYIHAEAYPAGEMKHGPLALIDENFPTMAIVTDSPVYKKMHSNIREVKSRGGPVIALATDGNTEISSIADDVIYVPKSIEHTQPIINAVALQLFAYFVAVEKGLNIDRPRNLAKSVTVE